MKFFATLIIQFLFISSVPSLLIAQDETIRIGSVVQPATVFQEWGILIEPSMKSGSKEKLEHLLQECSQDKNLDKVKKSDKVYRRGYSILPRSQVLPLVHDRLDDSYIVFFNDSIIRAQAYEFVCHVDIRETHVYVYLKSESDLSAKRFSRAITLPESLLKKNQKNSAVFSFSRRQPTNREISDLLQWSEKEIRKILTARQDRLLDYEGHIRLYAPDSSEILNRVAVICFEKHMDWNRPGLPNFICGAAHWFSHEEEKSFDLLIPFEDRNEYESSSTYTLDLWLDLERDGLYEFGFGQNYRDGYKFFLYGQTDEEYKKIAQSNFSQ